MLSIKRQAMIYVTVFLAIFFGAILPADTTRYYVTFLGRNVTSTPVGIFLQKLTGGQPVITHDVNTCSESSSTWGIPSDFNASEFVDPDCEQLVPNGIELGKKGIKVESVDDFTLHVIQTDSSGSWGDGYVAMSDGNLGSTYTVVTYCSTGGLCQFAALATADNTNIEITFPNNTLTRSVCINGSPVDSSPSSGNVIPFVINELDVIHFESEYDLTGTTISADKNIAVFVGARDIPKKDGTTSNMIEQIPPLKKWGTKFVVVSNYLNDAGDIIKIVTQEDNTIIYILGFSPFIIPKAGESVERRVDWQMHIEIHASAPVLIIQVMNLDLYNSSTNVNVLTGSPAMVLVPHIEQWVDTDHNFYCDVSANNGSLIAVVSESGGTVSVDPSPSTYYSPWETISGSHYDVMIAKPGSRETLVSGGRWSMYGLCEGKYALLLGANWDWENEGCQETISSPGDDVDNDCDGQVDEDTCTANDFSFSFTASQDSSGNFTYKTVNVGWAGHIDFAVTTCDVAVFTLRTSSYPQAYITVQISPNSIVGQICVPECFDTTPETNNVADCTNDVQHYTLEWWEDSVGLKHVFQTVSSDYFWDIDGAFGVGYQQMVLSAIAGSASFTVGLPVKDCSKYISDTADTAGKLFVVPVTNADNDYSIILSAKTTSLNVELSVDHSLGTITMNPSETITITKGHIIQSVYDSITIAATNGELLMYLLRSPSVGVLSGSSIIPSDVLGPKYLLFTDSTIDTTDTSAVICEAMATDRTTVSNAGQIITRDAYSEITNGIYAEGESYLGVKYLAADRPLAVFCGTFSDTLVQMPPKETLGTDFYIPKLNLGSINADAQIHIVSTEDSTILVIGGDYDQMDPVDFTGDFYIRTVQSNTIYSITANKPVQVHLEMRSAADNWASAVVIPPTTHYRNDHVFPGLSNTNYELVTSSAVDENGAEVDSLVTTAVLTGSATTPLTYSAGPVFSLSVLASKLDVGKKFVIASDVLYDDRNEICVVSKGYPGDGIDNDCDGLVDEECCSDSIEPGTIDCDLDGSSNEDCAAASTASNPNIEIPIPLSMLTCSPSGTTSGDTTISIDSGASTVTTPTTYPTISTSGTEATYDPITASTSNTVVIPTTSENSSEPVETCTTGCSCPCGWINPPQNYTAEELAEIVIEIQEKLKVSKAELSSTVRKKTSAQDDRPSATAVGYVGLASIVITIGAMALLDITTLFRDIRVMVKNLREVFEP